MTMLVLAAMRIADAQQQSFFCSRKVEGRDSLECPSAWNPASEALLPDTEWKIDIEVS